MKTKLTIIVVLVIFVMSCGLFQINQAQTEVPGSELPTATSQPDLSSPESSNNASQDETSLVWEKPFSQSYAITERIVYLGNPSTIEAVELNTGNVLWSKEYQGQIMGADSEYVYVVPSPQRLEALSASSGEVVWRVLSDYQLGRVTEMSANSVIVSTLSIYLLKINKQNGDILETFEGGIVQEFGDILVIPNFTDNTYFAWSKELERPILELPSSAQSLIKACIDLILYKNENTIGAVDRNGSPLWESQEISFPDCATERQFYAFYSGSLILENTSENVYAWKDILEGDIEKHKLVAVDKQSGKVNWVGLDNDFKWLGEVDGKVIYSNKGFGLTQAFDAKNHQLVWENSGLVMDALVGAAGKTIVGLTNVDFGSSTTVGINAENGEQIWAQSGDNQPLFIGDTLIFTGNSTVTFVDPQSGNTIQQITLSASPGGYSPVGDYLVAEVARPGVMTVAVIKR